MQDEDNDLLARSSLAIDLLPETDQDKQMAALMRLQASKTIAEREREKISDIMNRPALPSATITTFGGLKREKLLSTKLAKKDLGIVVKPAANESVTVLTENANNTSSSVSNESAPVADSTKIHTDNLSSSSSSGSCRPSTAIIQVDKMTNDSSPNKSGLVSLVSDDYFNSSSGSSSDDDNGDGDSKNLLFSNCI